MFFYNSSPNDVSEPVLRPAQYSELTEYRMTCV